MRDRILKHPEYTLVPVERSQEDPMYYPIKLFYMVDSEVLVESRQHRQNTCLPFFCDFFSYFLCDFFLDFFHCSQKKFKVIRKKISGL